MTSPQQTFSVSKKPQKQILSGMVDAVNNMLKDEDNYTLEESILVKAFDLKNDAVGLMYLMPNSYQYVFTPNQKELLQYTCRRIKFLLAVGAVPVVGVKDSPFDWEPTLKYGTDIDKITDNIIKEFELSKNSILTAEMFGLLFRPFIPIQMIQILNNNINNYHETIQGRP